MSLTTQNVMLQDSGQAGAEIEIFVTPEMIEAGLRELREKSFGEDLGWVLETVFRAMAYESPQLQIPRFPSKLS